MSDDNPIRMKQSKTGSEPIGTRFDLVRPRRLLSKSNIDYLKEFVAACETGEVSAYAICAIGPALATWRGASGGMNRSERVNLIGQLQLIIRHLSDEEEKNE